MDGVVLRESEEDDAGDSQCVRQDGSGRVRTRAGWPRVGTRLHGQHRAHPGRCGHSGDGDIRR